MSLRRLGRAVMHGGDYDWGIGIAAGVIALLALIGGSNFGRIADYGTVTIHHPTLRDVLVSAGSAVTILVFGVIATVRISSAVGSSAFVRAMPSAAAAVRLFVSGVGYLICAFAMLAVLDVGVGKLLVGAGLAGVILGIAAQPSLGNVFAGLVLVFARPFTIGDHIRIRSGALGGIFDAWVMDLSLAYVTLRTDDGVLRVPNASMLAAGVLQLTPESSPLPAPAAPPAPAPAAAPVAPPAPEGPALLEPRREPVPTASVTTAGGEVQEEIPVTRATRRRLARALRRRGWLPLPPPPPPEQVLTTAADPGEGPAAGAEAPAAAWSPGEDGSPGEAGSPGEEGAVEAPWEAEADSSADGPWEAETPAEPDPAPPPPPPGEEDPTLADIDPTRVAVPVPAEGTEEGEDPPPTLAVPPPPPVSEAGEWGNGRR